MITAGDEQVRALANLPAPPPDAPSPIKLADTRPLERALANAGFKDFHATETRRAMSTPFRAMLEKQTPELRRRIVDALNDAARKFADASGKVRMDNQAICISAHL
jgi:hypothetical protein